MRPTFTQVQRIATSGARAVEPFEIDGRLCMAIPQLALDKPSEPARLDGGDSASTTMPILAWDSGGFAREAELLVPGGEDAEFFRIGDRAFLATASLRTGTGPYSLSVDSVIYEYQRGHWVPFQAILTFAAKQWRHFSIDGRHFLALAQGVQLPDQRLADGQQSRIFAWDGARFVDFQTVSSVWGYNWKHVTAGGRHFLAYADHVAPSRILEWTGAQFVESQQLEGKSGRAACAFQSQGELWLAAANLLDISYLYRWNGRLFEKHQILCAAGARELLWLADAELLVQANFLLGSRDDPKPMTHSSVYAFDNGHLGTVDSFETYAAVDLAQFRLDGSVYLAVANSLGPGLRFRSEAMIYLVDSNTSVDD